MLYWSLHGQRLLWNDPYNVKPDYQTPTLLICHDLLIPSNVSKEICLLCINTKIISNMKNIGSRATRNSNPFFHSFCSSNITVLTELSAEHIIYQQTIHLAYSKGLYGFLKIICTLYLQFKLLKKNIYGCFLLNIIARSNMGKLWYDRNLGYNCQGNIYICICSNHAIKPCRYYKTINRHKINVNVTLRHSFKT